MQRHAISTMLVACVLTGTSWAADNPFTGKWKLNLSQSRFIDQMKVDAAGEGKFVFTFTPAAGSETVVVDGTDQPGIEGTTLAVTANAPNSWKVVRKKDGKILLTGIWTLSSDEKTLNDAYTEFGPDGSGNTTNFVYKRIVEGKGFAGTWESTTAQQDSSDEMEIRPLQVDGLTILIPAKNVNMNLRLDGKDYPNPGSAAGQSSSSSRRVDEHTLEVTRTYKGKPFDTRQIGLSPDLKTLTITVHPVGQISPTMLVFDRE